MKNAYTFIILLFLILSLPCFGNDGSYTIVGQGGSLMPIKNYTISMEKEKITIDVYMDYLYSYTLFYRCEFMFLNTKATKQNVLMGFPLFK